MELVKVEDVKVDYRPGEIVFNGYEELLNQAEQIAAHLKMIEVTADNIKENKKILAKVNKSIKELNDRRIAIKKEINKPYDEFALKIKEIEKVVKSADEVVRFQVRQLEEEEREDKREKLEEIWNKRIGQYDYARLFKFDQFLEGKHLNKTSTIKSVEEEMVDFLEKAERDIALLTDYENGKSLINSYLEIKDFATVIAIDKREKERIAEQEKILENVESKEKEKMYVFTIKDSKDAKLAEMLLRDNNIKFELIEK